MQKERGVAASVSYQTYQIQFGLKAHAALDDDVSDCVVTSSSQAAGLRASQHETFTETPQIRTVNKKMMTWRSSACIKHVHSVIKCLPLEAARSRLLLRDLFRCLPYGTDFIT